MSTHDQIPDSTLLGISYQAFALLGMYLLGVVATLGAAYVLNFIFKQDQKSYLLTELPIYRIPRWKAVGLTMFSKSKVFVLEAGKVILAVSVILWVLASYGPPSRMAELEAKKNEMLETANSEVEMAELENSYASKALENSYIAVNGSQSTNKYFSSSKRGDNGNPDFPVISQRFDYWFDRSSH